MDKDRQIRFLYPPLILIFSIALGIYFDNSSELIKVISEFLKSVNNTSIIVAILGTSSLILVLGFLLGTLTVFILRLLFITNDGNYEVKLSENSYKEIGKIILKDKKIPIKDKEKLYSGIIFDHGFMSKNIHQWIVRRWNAFFISSSSTLALISSLVIGSLLNISISCKWLLVTIPLMAIFILQSCFSWKETMGMIEFMIKVKVCDKSEKQTDPDDEEES